MSIYANGIRLLDESDKQPNWNLLTGTSHNLKTVTINKGNYYPGEYQRGDWQATPLYNGLATYSVYVINKSTKHSVLAEVASLDSGKYFTNTIAPNSEGRIMATAQNINGVYFKIDKPTDDHILATEDVVFQIKEEKLEPGNKVTQWLPAIVDLMLKNQNGGGQLAR